MKKCLSDMCFKQLKFASDLHFHLLEENIFKMTEIQEKCLRKLVFILITVKNAFNLITFLCIAVYVNLGKWLN